MSKIDEKEINKFIIFALSNEKKSLRDNPFREEKERRKVKNNIRNYLDVLVNNIRERD